MRTREAVRRAKRDGATRSVLGTSFEWPSGRCSLNLQVLRVSNLISKSPKERWMRPPRLFALGLVLLFLGLLSPYFSRATGFTSLIHIGEKSGPHSELLLKTPHYEHRDSFGYDGMYYAQLALEPSLADPKLAETTDNLGYRARRMLMSWCAYLAGFGQPFWVLQAYALINVFAWLGLAFLLWRWLPSDTWGNSFRWAGILFSHGAALSVHMALPDLPALLLVLVSVALVESERTSSGTLFLAAGALCKETSLISACVLVDPACKLSKVWIRRLGLLVLSVLPLALWLGYLKWGLGLSGNTGERNFSWPLLGLLQRWWALVVDIARGGDFLALKIGTLFTLVSLTVQSAFLLLYWRPKSLWWRMGAPFAVLSLFIAGAVWEGYPGAASRVLLPMMVAFNLLLPRGRRWLALLILGNLSVFSAFLQLRTVPVHFVQVSGSGISLAPVWESSCGSWYGDENDAKHRWRWAAGKTSIQLSSTFSGAQKGVLQGSLASDVERTVSIFADSRLVWKGRMEAGKRVRFSSSAFSIPTEGVTLHFVPDGAPREASAQDRRLLSFKLEDPLIVLGNE